MSSSSLPQPTLLVLGFLILAPLLLITCGILAVTFWFQNLQHSSLSLKTLDDPSLSWLNFMRSNLPNDKVRRPEKSETQKRVKLRNAHSKPSFKRGWIKVSSTPLPIKEPTMFERVQDLLIQNWVSSSNYLANRSSPIPPGKESLIPQSPRNISGDTLLDSSLSFSLLDGTESQHSHEVSGVADSLDNSASPRNLSTYLTKLPNYLFGTKLESDAASQSNSESERKEEGLKANDHSKLKNQRNQHEWKYAMFTKTELRLYRDDSCRELVTILNLPLYDVGLYPFDQLENEMFRCTSPIVLAGHSTLRPDPFRPTTSNSHERHFTVTKNSATTDYDLNTVAKETTGKPPEIIKPNTDRLSLPIYYLFAESNLDKEEWFQALVDRCRYVISNANRLRQSVEKYQPGYLLNRVYESAKQPFSHNPILLNPSPIDHFALEDLRTRLLGVDRGRDSIPPNCFKEKVEDSDSLNWFNALVGRFYLGVKDGSFLNNFLKSKVNTKLSQTLPQLLKLSLESVLMGPRFPRLPSPPELKKLEDTGRFELSVPLQHFGPLFDMKFELESFSGFRGQKDNEDEELSTVRQFLKALGKALASRWLNFKIPIRFKAWLGVSREGGQPFETDLIVLMGLPPTNKIYVSFKKLPEPAQLSLQLEAYDRIVPIPLRLVSFLLKLLANKVGEGNFVPVKIIPDKHMQPSVNPTPLHIHLACAKLPVLIQTLTKRHLESRCKDENCHNDQSRPSLRKRSCSMATVPLEPKLVAPTSDPTALLYPNHFTEPLGGFRTQRNRFSPTVVRVYDNTRGTMPIDQHPQHIALFSNLKLKVRQQATPKVSTVQIRAPHYYHDDFDSETLLESPAVKRLSQLFIDPEQVEEVPDILKNFGRMKPLKASGLLSMVQLTKPSTRVDTTNILSKSFTNLGFYEDSAKFHTL